MLQVDMKWKEPYVSGGFNKKLSGVIPKGVHYGFGSITALSEAMGVRVSGGSNGSLAVVDRNGYSLMVRLGAGQHVDVLNIPHGVSYLVVEALYATGQETTAELKAVSDGSVLDHHVVLAKFDVPGGVAELHSSHITVLTEKHGQMVRSSASDRQGFVPERLTFWDSLEGVLRSLKLNDVADLLTNKHEAKTNPHPQYIKAVDRVGETFMHIGTAPPPGALENGGKLYLRADYPRLWERISDPNNNFALVSDSEWQAGAWACFSTGDGSTTFRMPEMRGEGIRGYDNGRGVDGGREIGTHQDSQNKSHSHSADSGNAGHHNHTATASSAGSHDHSASTSSAGSHSHTGSTNTKGGHSHSLSVPHVDGGSGGKGLYYGGGSTSLTTNSAGSHSHSLSINSNGSHSHTVNVNDAGSHTHSMSVSNEGSHKHPVTVANSGGSEARMRNVSVMFCTWY